MKTFIYTTLLLFTGLIYAQGNYEKGMSQAFELWGEGKMEEAQNTFERISNAEQDEWLPHYYIAQISSLRSWSEKNEAVLKAQLSKAQEHLDIAMNISENNPELLVMQAQVLTNWVAYDGMTYGMKYSGKINELYNKAVGLAPNNPRAIFNKADWEMNSAKYFGRDTKQMCNAIEASIRLFDEFEPESDLHPDWGKERAEEVLKNCKSK